MSETNETILDLDALLETTLDAVEDLPDYIDEINGLYMLSIAEAEIKKPKDSKKPSRIVLTYKVDGAVEVEGVPATEGSLFSEGFQGTQDGLKFFKRQAKSLLNTDDLSGIPLNDLLAGLKSLDSFQAKVTTKRTIDKETKQEYLNIFIRPVH